MLSMKSKVKEVYATPIGHDVLHLLLQQLGQRERLITNPIVGNLSLQTLSRLASGKLKPEFFHALLALLNSETELPGPADGEISHKWWKEAVFYQIYPRSFMDSNGDGIGDLPGILQKLDYLHDLGVNALWLSPVYDSPNDDNGYDIRDYHKIMTEFGSMEDFDKLLGEVHKRGMHLIMDLVVNHTSDEHTWFQQALVDASSPYRDYYFFRDGGSQPPNNWTSFFSGSAWNHYEKQDTWALHLFSKKQMDLNHDNPAVRHEIADMVNWWLDKGVDGFRMDVINYISKGSLQDGDQSIADLMGYCGVEHYFYGPKLHQYLHELRMAAFEPHQAFSVGETPGLGMKMCQLITGEERKELDMVFSFDQLETPGHTRFDDYRYDLNYLRDYYDEWETGYGNQCWMSLFYNNHDNPRMLSKVDSSHQYDVEIAKLLAVIQFTLRGTPFVFQGDEMGLTNYDFTSMDEIDDVESKNMYQMLIQTMSPEDAFAKIISGTRDHARRPVPWKDLQEHQEMIDFYRTLIALRRGHEALVYGAYELQNQAKDCWVYSRTMEQEQWVVECNLGNQPRKAKFHRENMELILDTLSEAQQQNTATANMLQPYQARIYRKI